MNCRRMYNMANDAHMTRRELIQLMAHIRKHIGVYFPLILAITALIWTYPYNNIIYGLDSFNFFLYPFNTNFSPFILYSYKNVSNIVVDSAGNFYIDVFSYILSSLLAIQLVERIMIIISIFLAAYGIFHLLETLDRINGWKNRKEILAKLIVTSMYIANPFTLSTALWHFEGWSLFMVILPYWISTILEILFLESVSARRYTFTILLSIIMAPGLSGPYAVSSSYIILISSVFLFLVFLKHKKGREWFARRLVLLLLLPLSTLIWINLPAYLQVYLSGTNPQLSLANNYAIFVSNSLHSQWYHVLGLSALGWLYSYPQTYGWNLTYNSLLIWSGYLLIPLLILAMIKIRHTVYFYFLITLMVPIFIFSTGFNFPFGGINATLLKLNGPFLIITNAYYFMIEIYIVVLSIFIYSALLIPSQERSNFKRNQTQKKSINNFTIHSKTNIVPTSTSKIIIILAVCLLLIFWYPLLSDQEYQPNHSQIDEFALPTALKDVHIYLNRNYSNPNYYVLVLPLSSNAAYTFYFNGSSFVDSTSLFSALSPYPVISTNSSPFATVIDNFLSSNQYQNIVPVFDVMHIKYVIFNPYYPISDKSMITAPNGRIIDLKYAFNTLQYTLGKPQMYGNLSIFNIPNPIPITAVMSSLSLIDTSTFQTYLNFLSDLSNSSYLNTSKIESLIWTSSAKNLTRPNTYVSVYPFNGLNGKYPYQPASDIIGVNNASAVTNVSNIIRLFPQNMSYKVENESLILQSPILYSLNSNQPFSTSLNKSSLGLENSLGASGYISYGSLNLTQNEFAINLSVNVEKYLDSRWNYWGLIFSDGNYSVRVIFNINTTSNTYFVNEQAFYENTMYAWRNSIIPASDLLGQINLVLKVTRDEVLLGLNSIDSIETSFQSAPLYYSLQNITLDPGYNISVTKLAHNEPIFKRIGVLSLFKNAQIVVNNLETILPLPISYIAFIPYNLSTGFLRSQVSYSFDGNIEFYLTSNLNTKNVYVILGYPASDLWVALEDQSNTHVISVNEYCIIFKVTNLSVSTLLFGMNSNVKSIQNWLYFSFAETLTTVMVAIYFTFRQKKGTGRIIKGK